MRKKFISIIFLFVAFVSAVNAQQMQVRNPFIWADAPDPDIIRVGDYYYLVTTTMHLGTRYYEITESDLSEYNSFSISMYNSTMINNLALQMVVTQNNTPTSATYQFSSPIRTVIFDLANADKNCFITSNISLNGSIAYTPRVFYQEVQP